MRRFVRTLASVKLTVGLLAVLLVVLATGTIVESAAGTAAAARAVYDALWFRALLALFAVNVTCSLADRWPWDRQRAGYVLTHGAMLVVLAGALVTDVFKVEGSLALWEGEEGASFVRSDRLGNEISGARQELPFSVRLESFEIDTYPGTQRPAMFRSRVVVTDRADGGSFPAVIEMNRELSHHGWKLFQSGYEQGPDRDQTVLAVSRDSGQPVVFVGYALLLAGMVTVLATRIAQRRALAKVTGVAKPAPRRAVKVAALLLALLAAPAARAAWIPDPETTDRLARLPVQHDGRVMPLDTMAREAVFKVTGRRAWGAADPVALVLGWSFDPEGSRAERLVRVEPELAAALGLPRGQTHASFEELVHNARLQAFLEEAREQGRQGKPVGALHLGARKLEDRLVRLQGFLDRTSLRLIPVPGDPNAAWSVPGELRQVSDLLPWLDPPSGAALPPEVVSRELTYNRLRPTRLSWWILSAAIALSLLAWRLGRKPVDILAVLALATGFAAMTWGIGVRWAIAGRIPASNMYESLLFLGWGVGLFALLALAFLRSRLVVLNAAAGAALTMGLADLLPLDPFIHPVPPVLSGTVWLAIHVPIIMLSYSVLGLGVVLAHLQVGCEIFAGSRRELVQRMNDLLYWYLHVGSILLLAGILSGSVWAASSWGRYWGWDPKEVWSLVAFLAYLAILHGRLDKLFGPFAMAALSIAAFWTIVMTYVGVNYVLAAGLHAYGSGGAGVARWLLVLGAAEAVFLSAGYVAHTGNRRRQPVLAASLR